MRDRLDEGIALFNSGRYFEAHEAFEDLWRASEGDLRLVYQGLVQACAGLVKQQRGEPASSATLLGKGLRKLRSAPAGCPAGLDVQGFATALESVVRAIESRVSYPPPVMARLPHL